MDWEQIEHYGKLVFTEVREKKREITARPADDDYMWTLDDYDQLLSPYCPHMYRPWQDGRSLFGWERKTRKGVLVCPTKN